MKRRIAALAVFVVALAIGLVGYRAFRRPALAREGFRTGVFEPPRKAPDFTLDGSNGAKVSLRDYLGKIVVLEFGFSSCSQVCPVTLSHLAEVDKKLGPAAADVQVIFVTVDPKRDSPARLREFLRGFDPRFVGATSDPDELARVRDAYGILAEEVASKNEEQGYQVNHSSFVYLIDRKGSIRTLVPFGTPADDIVADIRLLLR